MKAVAYVILFLCCILGIYALNHSYWGTTGCAEYESQINRHYKGVVINKWQDRLNHSYPMLRVQLSSEQGDFSRDFNFLADTGDFYKFVAIGDSIKKRRGLLEVGIKRNEKDTVILLKPACN